MQTTHFDASSLASLELMLNYAPASTDGKARALCLAPDTALPGASSMPNISECPNDAIASSLSDILETGDLPPKYYLSPKACAGILRRAKRRGEDLPAMLAEALKQVADSREQRTTKP